MPEPKLSPEHLLLIRSMQNLTESNIKLKESIDSLANSVNDFAVMIEAFEPEELPPPGTTFN